MRVGISAFLLPLSMLAFVNPVFAGGGEADDDKSKSTIEGEILKTLRENGVITDQQFKDLTNMADKLRAQRADTDRELDKELKRLTEYIDLRVHEQATKPATGPSATATINWENGFFLRSADGNFELHPFLVVRERLTGLYPGSIPGPQTTTQALSNESTWSFEKRPTRLWFDGYAFSKDLTFLVNFDFAGPTPAMRAAYLDYKVADEFHVRGGQQIRPVDFEGFMWAPRTVMVDKAPPVYFFQAAPAREWEAGVMLWGQLFDKQLEWYAGAFNSDGGNNGPTLTNLGLGQLPLIPVASHNNDHKGLDYNGRLFYSPTGGFDPNDRLGYIEGDYGRSDTPKFGFGIAGGYNPEAVAETVTPPTLTPLAQNIFTGSLDGVFKYEGLFALAEFFYQHIDNEAVGAQDLTNTGWFAQVGYFFGSDVKNRGFEAIMRFSNINTENAPIVGAPNFLNAITGVNDWTVGLNYAFAGHRLKIQTAYTYRERQMRVFHDIYDSIIQIQVQLIF